MENSFKGAMPDIAANVRSIEKGKNNMLSYIAEIFNLMASDYDEYTAESIEAKISELIIESYCLAQKMGTDAVSLNEIILNNLRMKIINEDGQTENYKNLYDFLKK